MDIDGLDQISLTFVSDYPIKRLTDFLETPCRAKTQLKSR